MTLATVVDFALAYAGAGFRVLPLHIVVEGCCTCGEDDCKSPGKHPRVEHGAHDATVDEATIRAWWQRWPGANVGMTLDGYVVVDVDPRNGGTLDALPHTLPDTCYARTGGGGAHYLYRARNGTRYPGQIVQGVDMKSGGGSFVIVEPSVHASGEKYVWLDETEPWTTTPADAPEWLSRASNHARTENAEGPIPEGGRNAHLTSLAGTMRRRGMTPQSILAALLTENAARCSPLLSDDEVKSITASVSKYQPADGPPGPEIIVKCSPLDWRALGTLIPPDRVWALLWWIALGVPTLLVGAGGAGKTLLMLQLGACLTLAHRFIDDIPQALRVLLWCCEDDADELWRRMADVARWLGVRLEDFADRFIIVPRVGLDNTLFTTEFGRPMWTPAFEELRAQAGDYGAQVLMLDNSAQLYGGNENDRHLVTTFVNGLMGAHRDRAVILAAHPSRQAGSEFSGSSAWENAHRTRLYLGRNLPDQQGAENQDCDDVVRYLSRRKANYGPRDFRRLTFKNGVLVPDEVEIEGGMMGHLRRQKAERVVLEAARRLQQIGTRMTDGSTSPQFLPKLIVEHKLNEGRTKRELAEAMREAMLGGKLTRGVVGKYQNRLPMHGLMVVD